MSSVSVFTSYVLNPEVGVHLVISYIITAKK